MNLLPISTTTKIRNSPQKEELANRNTGTNYQAPPRTGIWIRLPIKKSSIIYVPILFATDNISLKIITGVHLFRTPHDQFQLFAQILILGFLWLRWNQLGLKLFENTATKGLRIWRMKNLFSTHTRASQKQI